MMPHLDSVAAGFPQIADLTYPKACFSLPRSQLQHSLVKFLNIKNHL